MLLYQRLASAVHRVFGPAPQGRAFLDGCDEK